MYSCLWQLYLSEGSAQGGGAGSPPYPSAAPPRGIVMSFFLSFLLTKKCHVNKRPRSKHDLSGRSPESPFEYKNQTPRGFCRHPGRTASESEKSRVEKSSSKDGVLARRFLTGGRRAQSPAPGS